MSARISDYKDKIYHRDYGNDFAPQTDLAKRAAVAVIPFLALIPSLRVPISVIAGSFRAYSAENLSSRMWAVGSVACAVLQCPIAMVLTTLQDLVIEAQKLQKAENLEDKAKSTAKILNHLLYLGMITYGGLELSIAALLMQAAVQAIQAGEEWKNQRWIETGANLLMTAVRLKQAHTQYGELKRKWEIEEAIKHYHVGTLGENWQFPSDHLPGGIEVNGTKIISWNVMNSLHMGWVKEKDSQGLNGSMITQLDEKIADDGLTLRDVKIVDMIQSMMSQGHVIALQECSQPFLRHLQERLPSDWQLVKSFDSRDDQTALLYNSSHLSLKSSVTSTSAYPSAPGRPLQEVNFTNHLRIVNGHIPGNPNLPGREEYAQYVHSCHQEGDVTVALGDYNFERHEMISAFFKAGFRMFNFHSLWQTNIDPYSRESKGIDHFFVLGTEESRDLSPKEILQDSSLPETIDLLRGK